MRKLAGWMAALLLWAALVPCAAAESKRYETSFLDVFDTFSQVVVYADTQEAAQEILQTVHDELKVYHRLFDIYQAYEGVNNLYTVNQNAGIAPVAVEQPLYDLLTFGKEIYAQTGGKTNIALGSVLSIWHEYREAGLDDPDNAKLPPMEDLQAAAQHMDINNLILDAENRTVYFADPEMKLDVGAVAKGYATELVAQTLLASDMPSFIISAGGNVRMGNPPADGRAKWGVGIQDPDGAVLGLSDIVETLYLTGCSVVTSGDYQRYYVVDGQRYHHLIDPDTLMPDTDFRSVSIITEDSGYADLLSTAAFLMPYEESRAFIDSLDGVEAIWLFPDGSKKMTFGAMNVAKSCGATNQ